MIEDSKASTSASSGTPLRRALTGDESAQFRHRPPINRFSTTVGDVPSPGLRRRSSAFSDYSINEARKSFQESADDVLLPTPNVPGSDTARVSSNWDSAPLAFALLPAVGGMFFTNGSAVITDIMLLGLAAIFLNWSVRLPWNWYHSAQAIRKKEEYNGDTVIDTDSDDENALSFSQSSLDKVPEEGADGEAEMQSDVTSKPVPKTIRRLPAHEAASTELYTHEMLALLSCFVFPLLGAYLLHTIRSQLTRPSEGLVSNYNLTIFLLASELRPMSHLVKLIQSRTLHLQRVVNSNPYDSVGGKQQGDVKELVQRIEELEARATTPTETPSGNGTTEQTLSAKQIATLATEVRRTLQPELDALNRAVRRYEKRQTLQTFQTESRLYELEGRLSDAISLAAAAANNGHSRHGFSTILLEWVAAAFVLPLQAFGALASLPFKTIIALINYGKVIFIGRSRRPVEKGKKTTNGKYPSHSRMGADRLQGRVTKR